MSKVTSFLKVEGRSFLFSGPSVACVVLSCLVPAFCMKFNVIVIDPPDLFRRCLSPLRVRSTDEYALIQGHHESDHGTRGPAYN